jgi:nitroreductase
MSTVAQTLLDRRSIRAYLDRPVPADLVREIVDIARQSPSSGNLQPWRLFALAGDDLAVLKAAVQKTLSVQPKGEGMGYPIYPEPLKSPYDARRAQCGEDLYAAINVTRDDRAGRQQQFARNFSFFGAPVGLFLTVDRSMGNGQWADLGMFLQSLMLVAHEQGLATCAQACWTLVHKTVAEQLALPPELMVFCGIALGYADPDAPINGLKTARASLAEVAEFRGFGHPHTTLQTTRDGEQA